MKQLTVINQFSNWKRFINQASSLQDIPISIQENPPMKKINSLGSFLINTGLHQLILITGLLLTFSFSLVAQITCPDADEDGYSNYICGGDDCDDFNNTIHPNAQEICNGNIDDDCNGLADDADPGVVGQGGPYYYEGDNDGFGEGNPVFACVQPVNYVTIGGDCGGGSDDIYPGAPEYCNGFDEDCDGVADNDPQSFFYADNDGDGFGAGEPIQTCTQPPNTSANNLDCDDTNSAVNPSVQEICNSDLDDDCDGSADDLDDSATGKNTYFPDNDGDGYGFDDPVYACIQPVNTSVYNTDCNDLDNTINPGAQEICNGNVDDNCDYVADDYDATVTGQGTYYPDYDGDGYGAGSPIAACEQGYYVTNADDCNDSDFNINPTAQEICNGNVDDDCDGNPDDSDASVTGQGIYYADADGDGYGAGSPIAACEQGYYVTNADDCNDSDFNISPAAYEVCNSWVDDDCDGLADDDDFVFFGQSPYYYDYDYDGYGSFDVIFACIQPYMTSTNYDDCNDYEPNINPAAQEVCNETDDDCDGLVDEGQLSPYMPDYDGDGFGAGEVLWACYQPPGYVPDCSFAVVPACDCDDSNFNINPAATEICNGGIDDDCNGYADDDDYTVIDQTTYYFDGDNDGYGEGFIQSCTQNTGYVLIGGDCYDASADIYPGAPEECNGIDEDCDGVADNDVQSFFYPDMDGDGFGAGDPIQTCTQPPNTSNNNLDCDDTNNNVSPVAQEICNSGVDDDCDGQADDADGSVTGQNLYYEDHDYDGYGAGSPYFACLQTSNASTIDGDCDNGNFNINPGVEEICNGDVDDDCDGLADDQDNDVIGQGTYFADNDGDNYGAGDAISACLQPANSSSAGGDCDESNAAIHPGADEICNGGVDDDCDGAADSADNIVYGQSSYYYDYDGDGNGAGPSFLSCTQPPNTSTTNNDCDNYNSAVYQGSPILCNDACTGAQLTNLNNYFNCPTNNVSFGISPSLSCHNGGQYDIWRSFTVPASGAILINNIYNLNAIAVYSGTCGDLSLIRCYEVINGNNNICSGFEITGLTPGTICRVQAVTDTPQSNAGFWIYDLLSGVSNDLCSGAVPVSPGAENSCPSGQISGTTVNARHNIDLSCTNNFQCNYLDVWYSFTAPSTGVVKYTPGTGSPVATIFSGNCNALTQVACRTAQDNITLTPGATYYLAISTYHNQGLGIPFSFCLDIAPAPPANDNCNGAIVTSVSANGSCSNVTGTTENASLSMAFPCAFGGNEQYLDTWYTFTAPAGGKVTFRSGTNNPFAVIHSGGCGSLSVVGNGCIRGSGTVSNLTPGDTYYLQLLTSGTTGKAFDFCLEIPGTAPANNACANAVPVELNAPVTVNSIYALTSQLPPCAPLPSLNAPDLWYTFSGPSDGNLGYAFGGGTIAMSVYSGVCGNLTDVTCAVPLGGSAPNNLTPGATYYAQLTSIGAVASGTATLSGIPSCTPVDWYLDSDGDGYGAGVAIQACSAPANTVSNNTDCNNAVATVYPGATELCNSMDDDCDGILNEGYPTTTYYRDFDGDGKGNPAVTIQSCYQPAGYVTNANDCDDNSATACPKPSGMSSSNITDVSATVSWGFLPCATKYRLEYRRKTPPISDWTIVYPTSPTFELTGLAGPNIQYQWRVATICSPNGTTAESGYASLQSFYTKYKVYTDADMDGFGDINAAPSYVSPMPQPGYSANQTDCDDAAATTYVGAPELCNDIDDDCDLIVDEGANWYQDADGDGLGNAAVSLNACIQPSGYVANSADCNDNSTTPACATPVNVTATGIGVSFVTINWNTSPCASSYTVMYRIAPSGAFSTQFNTTGNTMMLTGLLPSTTYQARVRAKCPAPNTVTTSNWVYVTFTTNGTGLIEEVEEDISILDPVTFGVYPNPGDGRFTLSIPGDTDGEADISVLDGFGKLIQTVRWSVYEGITVNELDLTHLPGGVYHINIRQGDMMQTKKVVIVR
jgi:hypothetical protein